MAKKLPALILAMVFLVFALPAQQVIKVGIFDLKPHLSFNELTKKAQGSAVEYLSLVAQKMGYAIEWSLYPFPRLIQMIYKGDLDCSIIISKSTEREQYLVFGQSPVFITKPILVVKNHSPLKEIKTGADIKGLKIGFLAGVNKSPFMKENESRFTWELLNPENAATLLFGMLFKNRIDAIYDLNDVTYPYEAKQQGIRDKIRILHIPDSVGGVYTVASKSSKIGVEFLNAYNEFLRKHPTPYAGFLKPYME